MWAQIYYDIIAIILIPVLLKPHKMEGVIEEFS